MQAVVLFVRADGALPVLVAVEENGALADARAGAEELVFRDAVCDVLA